jgi:hypothetical protein
LRPRLATGLPLSQRRLLYFEPTLAEHNTRHKTQNDPFLSHGYAIRACLVAHEGSRWILVEKPPLLRLRAPSLWDLGAPLFVREAWLACDGTRGVLWWARITVSSTLTSHSNSPTV